MITAALHAETVSPARREYDTDTAHELARIAAEIAERLDEMNEIKLGSARDLVCRLAMIARLPDPGAFAMLIALLHGRTECLLDSYEARANFSGRKKQTEHYRSLTSIAAIRTAFPEVAQMLTNIRLSVEHHEDPPSKADALRGASRED